MMDKQANPKVSIIIPVYNVQHYLSQCIESCINQTLREIEIILVNDGSSDKSGDICDLYAKKDNRIFVIHKVNEGVGQARNRGIQQSKGEYIYFVDADDWIDNTLLEECFEWSDHYQFDIIQFGFKKVDVAGKIIRSVVPPALSINEISVDRDQLIPVLSSGTGLAVWDKLIRAEVLKENQILFDNKKRGEDFTFVFNCLDKTVSFFSIDKAFYNYRIIYGSQNKFDFNIINNHLFNYRKAFLFFGNKPSFNKKTKEYLLKLALLWFLLVIPLNIVNTKKLKKDEKLNLLKGILTSPELKGWLLSFQESGLDIKNRILLKIYKIGQPQLLFMSAKILSLLRRTLKLSN